MDLGITLRVNGPVRQLSVDTRATLLARLRLRPTSHVWCA